MVSLFLISKQQRSKAQQNTDNNPQPFDALAATLIYIYTYANGVNCHQIYAFVQIDYILKGSCYLAPTQI